MSDSDKQDEQADFAGHSHLVDEGDESPGETGMHRSDQDDDTPDIEGHFHKKSPVRFHKK